MSGFMFATGIENSSPTVRLPDGRITRVDEMEKCRHYLHWREDFALVKSLGIQYLRYGVPYHRTHLAPGRYDWSFADDTFTALRDLGITPIADLCHFGVPDWVGSFQNPEWPEHFAEYAREFARRYPWVSYYTPVNEIYIAAVFSAGLGWWNEARADELSFVTALHTLCRANVLAMRAIQREAESPTFVQSESVEYFHPEEPSCRATAAFLNERRFLSLDLSYGRPLSLSASAYLLDHGLTQRDYLWFRENRVQAPCILGTDYYHTSEHIVHPGGRLTPAGDLFGYYVLARQYYKRYRLPLMHTETNRTDPHAVDWLRKQWATVQHLRQDGVPVVGFTWYGLTDMVDWDTALRQDRGRVNAVGLFDLNRRIRPVGEAYRKLIEQWGSVLLAEGPAPLARTA
jgi:beta-glucosidase/6-phospho-beta-glucosidase/beta-galactosidase